MQNKNANKQVWVPIVCNLQNKGLQMAETEAENQNTSFSSFFLGEN